MPIIINLIYFWSTDVNLIQNLDNNNPIISTKTGKHDKWKVLLSIQFFLSENSLYKENLLILYENALWITSITWHLAAEGKRKKIFQAISVFIESL